MVPTGVEKIDARLGKLDPGSLRHQVMTALRQFRASWVELGRLLNEVVFGGDYKEWGYDDFEVYCAKELGLKKPTVQKLMISYNYMRKYESKRLEKYDDNNAEPASIPDYQTVELLDRIRHREDLPEEQVEELHRRAFDDGEEEPELRKELRQRLKPQRDDAEIRDLAAARKMELATIQRIGRDLRRRIATTNAIPGGLRDRLDQCLLELEGVDGL